MQFSDKSLPTLDTALWVEQDEVKFKFFEKPTVGNQVLHKNTALPMSCIRASLLQETVRRLLNCSPNGDVTLKRDALDKFSRKLVNSGHSNQSARIILVQGVTKYMHKLSLSQLDQEDPRYKPLYVAKDYMEGERQKDKFLAKTNWYRKERDLRQGVDMKKESWKDNLRGVWKGTNHSQKQVHNMQYSTILQVPSSPNSVLLNNLIKSEDRLAVITGYNVKLVEQSGIQLARLFPRVFNSDRCHWSNCPACREYDGKGGSRCRLSNVIYEGKCMTCEDEYKSGKREKKKIGCYIGESSRTLAERTVEHERGANSFETDNFIVKHWVIEHPESNIKPRIRFKVIKSFNDPLSRLVSESVWIEKVSNMNSKSEWRNNKMSRLVVESPSWMPKDAGRKKALKDKDKEDETEIERKIDDLRMKMGRPTQADKQEKKIRKKKRDQLKISNQEKRKTDKADDVNSVMEVRNIKRRRVGFRMEEESQRESTTLERPLKEG